MNQTVLSTIPANRNFLSQIPYQFIIRRTPNLNYFIQKAKLPGISSQNAIQSTIFSDIPKSGVKLTWNPLFVSFKVDEELMNWQEIFNWLTAINLSDNFDDYESLAKNPSYTGLNVTSEIMLILHDMERNPSYNIYFHNAFPITLSDLDFESSAESVEFIAATATFKYSTYSIEPVI